MFHKFLMFPALRILSTPVTLDHPLKVLENRKPHTWSTHTQQATQTEKVASSRPGTQMCLLVVSREGRNGREHGNHLVVSQNGKPPY